MQLGFLLLVVSSPDLLACDTSPAASLLVVLFLCVLCALGPCWLRALTLFVAALLRVRAALR